MSEAQVALNPADAVAETVSRRFSRETVGSRTLLRADVIGLGSCVAASLSWRWFESPINNWKRFFPYSATPAETSI